MNRWWTVDSWFIARIDVLLSIASRSGACWIRYRLLISEYRVSRSDGRVESDNRFKPGLFVPCNG